MGQSKSLRGHLPKQTRRSLSAVRQALKGRTFYFALLQQVVATVEAAAVFTALAEAFDKSQQLGGQMGLSLHSSMVQLDGSHETATPVLATNVVAKAATLNMVRTRFFMMLSLVHSDPLSYRLLKVGI